MRRLMGNALVRTVEFERKKTSQIESGATVMKAINKYAKKQRDFGIVRKNGRIALPPDFSKFRLGQRVYFHLQKEGVVFAATPKRTFNGRLLSSRIRRGLRTLAMYGPRTTASAARR